MKTTGDLAFVAANKGDGEISEVTSVEQPRCTAGSGWLAIVAMGLTTMGLVVVASASATLHRPIMGEHFFQSVFGRQCVFAAVGFGLMWIVGTRIGPWLLEERSRLKWATLAGALLTVGMLIVVLLVGEVTRGSQRWLRFPIAGFEIGIQPSELAKPVLVALLALGLTRAGIEVRSFRRAFLPLTLGIAVAGALVGSQDLGTAAIICLVGGLMVVVAGCDLRHAFLLGLLGAAGFIGLVIVEPYRMDRLWAFKNMWNDPQGSGYQAIQSLATLASGGWEGRGLGAGIQKYGYLPESRTDFVFAVLCEEMGFIGGAAVVLLLCLFVFLGLSAMRRARTPMEALLAFGLTSVIGVQALLNIAVVTVAVPTTGIPLPFISAGGSSFLVLSSVVGMLMAVAVRGETAAEPFLSGSKNAPGSTMTNELTRDALA